MGSECLWRVSVSVIWIALALTLEFPFVGLVRNNILLRNVFSFSRTPKRVDYSKTPFSYKYLPSCSMLGFIFVEMGQARWISLFSSIKNGLD